MPSKLPVELKFVAGLFRFVQLRVLKNSPRTYNFKPLEGVLKGDGERGIKGNRQGTRMRRSWRGAQSRYGVLEWALRASLVYWGLTRVGATKAPDAETMGAGEVALGRERIEMLHVRVVQIARENRVVQGRKMRLDTTVVETNIHYPTLARTPAISWRPRTGAARILRRTGRKSSKRVHDGEPRAFNDCGLIFPVSVEH